MYITYWSSLEICISKPLNFEREHFLTLSCFENSMPSHLKNWEKLLWALKKMHKAAEEIKLRFMPQCIKLCTSGANTLILGTAFTLMDDKGKITRFSLESCSSGFNAFEESEFQQVWLLSSQLI